MTMACSAPMKRWAIIDNVRCVIAIEVRNEMNDPAMITEPIR